MLVVIGFVILILWLIKKGKTANEIDWGSPSINVIDGLMRLYCRSFQRLQADPLELPKEGGVLVVCNHITGLDPLIKLTACKRPLRYLIAKEEYDRPILHRLYKGVGCIPVERTGRPEIAFRAAIKALKNGEAIALYPHGGIHADDWGHRTIKAGVFRLSDLTDAEIIPTRLTGIRRPGSSFSPLFLRGNVKLQVFPKLEKGFSKRPDAKQQLGDLLLGRIPAIEKLPEQPHKEQ